MKKTIRIFFVTLFLATLITFSGKSARAASAVVGTGTPASCTEASLNVALSTASNGGGTVTFNCGPAVTTITLSTTKFLNLGNVTIDGGGRIILNANNGDRHFFAGSGITLRLLNITLRDGNSLVGGGAIEASGATILLEGVQLLNNYSSVQGGAIYCYDGTLTVVDSLFENNGSRTGGAIYNDGCAATINNTTFRTNDAIENGGAIHNAQLASLTMNDSVFDGNTALDGGGLYNAAASTATLNSVIFRSNSGGYGGGLENSGTVDVSDSLFELNTVTGSGGGLWNLGGTVNMQRTTVRNNTAYEGGGVNSYGTLLQMENVNIVGNVASGSHGGGIFHGGGAAFLRNASITGNRANDPAANGGGIYQASDDNLTLVNATVANNQAGLLGGGFYHYSRYAVLTNVTFANNLAGAAGDAIYENAPLTPGNPGVVQIANSVIFGSAVNCDGELFQSLGNNISKGSCAALSAPTDTDNYSGNLLVGNLAFNGGDFPMQTILPLAGSPLIDAGDPTQCWATDQRGFNRLGLCDLGAAEYRAESKIFLPLLAR